MNFLIIVSNDNFVNIESLKSQVNKDDILYIENLSKFPSRIIHRILINTKSKKCTKVIIIGPQSTVSDGLLYYLRSYGKEHKAFVIEDSREFNTTTHRFIRIPDYHVFKHDIVCFNKDIYRGRLADLSSHLQYEDILNIILQPVVHSIMVATRNVVEKAIQNLIDYNNDEEPVDVFTEKLFPEPPLPPPPSYYVTPETFEDIPFVEILDNIDYTILNEPEYYKIDNSYSLEQRDKYDPTIIINQRVNKVDSFYEIEIKEVILDDNVTMECYA